jgi:hypothetical protein
MYAVVVVSHHSLPWMLKTEEVDSFSSNPGDSWTHIQQVI